MRSCVNKKKGRLVVRFLREQTLKFNFFAFCEEVNVPQR